MNVTPDDLANLCAIFSVLRTNQISPSDLRRYVEKSLRLTATASASQIIDEASQSGLIVCKSTRCLLTDCGLKVAYQQGEPRHSLIDKTKKALAQHIYLNSAVGDKCCGSFMLQFRVDTVAGSFVYDRKRDDAQETNDWLMTLQRVNVIDVDADRAVVRPEYLGKVNDLLRQLREASSDDIPQEDNENNEVGKVAEECAMAHEKERLVKLGHPDLAALVKQISLVDTSAGYDIASYRGTGKAPDQSIFIEVKGTRKSEEDFIWSRNERHIAKKMAKLYWIYSFTQVSIEDRTAIGPRKIVNPVKNLSRKGYRSQALDVRVRRSTSRVRKEL